MVLEDGSRACGGVRSVTAYFDSDTFDDITARWVILCAPAIIEQHCWDCGEAFVACSAATVPAWVSWWLDALSLLLLSCVVQH
jgi:hypothetical protein